jgi:hypothetical protein
MSSSWTNSRDGEDIPADIIDIFEERKHKHLMIRAGLINAICIELSLWYNYKGWYVKCQGV